MDISKIFHSQTRKELFRLYFTNPDQKYYLRELERQLSIPVSMIRAELLRLEKDGIFYSSRQGNLTYYALNRSYPLFEELKSIVFKTIGIQGELKNILSPMKGIEAALIYGSFARKQETAQSDIDILIIGTLEQSTLPGRIRKLENKIQREINYTVLTPEEFRGKIKEKGSFLEQVMKNPVIFLVGDKNVLRKIS